MGTKVFVKERAMPEQMTTEDLHKNPRARRGVASSSDCWDEYQTVLRYLRGYGKEHPPTGRLILLTMIGHEADASQISIDAGACAYAINTNLAQLTKQGILVRRILASGRFKSSRYRINQDVLTSRLGLTLKTATAK
jgi:hypothetical protein